MKVWAGEGNFLALLKSDPSISDRVDTDALEACFDEAYHTKEVDRIFARVFVER